MNTSKTMWRVNKIDLSMMEVRRRSWANHSDNIVFVGTKKEARQIMIDVIGDKLNDTQDLAASLALKLSEAIRIDVT